MTTERDRLNRTADLNRRIAELEATVASWKEGVESANRLTQRFAGERDAALARVGVLEGEFKELERWHRRAIDEANALRAALRAVLPFAEGAVNEAAGWSAKDEQEGRAAVRAARAALSQPREPTPSHAYPDNGCLHQPYRGNDGWTYCGQCGSTLHGPPDAPAAPKEE